MKSLSNLNRVTRRLLATTALFALLFAPGASAQTGPSPALGTQFPLYVADIGNNSIIKVESTGQQSVLTSEGYLAAPAALALDGSGNLYVANFPQGSQVIVKVDTTTGAQSVFTTFEGSVIPVGLAFDGIGNLYVSVFDGGTGAGSIVKVDGAGSQSAFSTESLPYPITALAFDSSGLLFAGVAANGIAVFGSDGTFLGGIPLAGDANNFPWGLAFNSSGNLFVSSFFDPNIVKVDFTTGTQSLFTSFGSSIPFLPGLAFDSNGNLFVSIADSNTSTGSIYSVSSAGSQSVFTSGGAIALPTALAFTRGYNFTFTGFFQPVDNLPTVNVAKAGAAIPVKFSLGGYQGLGIITSGYPASHQVACSASSPVSAIDQTVAAGGSSLTYNPTTDQYTYVWKTNSAWKNTCRWLTVKLSDGSEHSVNFQFK
jgi:hypothetical protein